MQHDAVTVEQALCQVTGALSDMQGTLGRMG